MRNGCSTLARTDVVYADAGYQGASKRPESIDDPHLSNVQFRVASRKGTLAAMAGPDRQIESRKASSSARTRWVSWSRSWTLAAVRLL